MTSDRSAAAEHAQKLLRQIGLELAFVDPHGQKPAEELRRLVSELEQAVAMHAKKQKAAPDNWGHAGDMAHVAEQLQEVLTFLKGDAK